MGEISRGATSTVYLARTSSGAEVAVKVFSEDQPHRFGREVEAMLRLDHHPNVVQLLDYGQDTEGRNYLVMEYLPTTLAEWATAETEMPWQEALRWLLPLADALHQAHLAGVLHKDIKPSNILLDAEGNPKLADFGISAVNGTTETTTPQLTYHYAAPEVLDDDPSSLDQRSDVYSLAATLEDLIFPFFYSRPAHVQPSRPTRRTGFTPFDDLLRVALSSAPKDRFSSAAEFADQARSALRISENLLQGPDVSVESNSVCYVLSASSLYIGRATPVEDFDIARLEPDIGIERRGSRIRLEKAAANGWLTHLQTDQSIWKPSATEVGDLKIGQRFDTSQHFRRVDKPEVRRSLWHLKGRQTISFASTTLTFDADQFSTAALFAERRHNTNTAPLLLVSHLQGSVE